MLYPYRFWIVKILQKSKMTKEFKIFLVEDSRADELYLKQLLKKTGITYELTSVSDGESALEILLSMPQEHVPDLIFLDIKVPKINGFELLKILRQKDHFAKVHLVVTTGSDDPDDLHKTEQFGAHYMRKPPKMENICKILGVPQVSELLDPRVARRQAKIIMNEEKSVKPEKAWRLLLVEDNPVQTKLVKILLSDNTLNAKFEITSAGDLKTALFLLEKNQFDVAAIDLQLPDCTGLQTFMTIQNLLPTLPIVIVTGNDDETMAREAVSLGAQDFVLKSSQNFADSLARTLQYAIHRKRGERLSRTLERKEANEHFIALLAHELKSPLKSATNILTSLVENRLGELQPNQKEILKQVIEEQDNLLSMINDILNAYEFEKKIDSLEFKPTNINLLIENTIKQFRPRLDERNIKIVTKMQELELVAKIHEQSIEQALHNVIDNAIKYSYNDSVVYINLNTSDERFELKIKDSGPGISSQIQPKIFQRLWQGVVAGHYQPGSGQGLYYCKQIIDAHNGIITLESDGEQGTTLKIILPI